MRAKVSVGNFICSYARPHFCFNVHMREPSLLHEHMNLLKYLWPEEPRLQHLHFFFCLFVRFVFFLTATKPNFMRMRTLKQKKFVVLT